jgi:hypothetical protein
LPVLNASQFDLKRLHKDLRKDVDALREAWRLITAITAREDAKLNRLKELLVGDLRGRKVLIFTYYKDTARYLYKQLCNNDEATIQWREQAGAPHIRCMDSGADTRERAKFVAQFAPRANNRDDIAGSEHEIDIMISTDVLSEGQNLQDCGTMINYDLHWNPTRMIQRAGRIDRIGTSYDTLWIMNMFPDEGLEKLLRLVESLSLKIAEIDRSGLLDASVLGEVVHPQNFNTMQRIENEDGSIIEEQEQFAELVSSEFLLQQLKELLDRGMRQQLEALPDGIHSGHAKLGAKGVFFYFTTKKARKNGIGSPVLASELRRQHFWRYIDLSGEGGSNHASIEENRYLITSLLQCEPETLRVVPLSGEVNIFELQERVISSILRTSAEQAAREEAPRLLDPIQQTIGLILRRYLNHPGVERKDVIAALQRVNVPQPRVYVKTLRKAHQHFMSKGQIQELLSTVLSIGEHAESAGKAVKSEETALLKREDLKLVCFEYVW